MHTGSSSSLVLASPTASTHSLNEFNHMSSLLAISAPGAGSSSSPPFHGDLVPLIDVKALGHQAENPHKVCVPSILLCTAYNSFF